MNFLENVKGIFQKMTENATTEKKGFILGCGVGGIILGIFPPWMTVTTGIGLLIISVIMIESSSS